VSDDFGDGLHRDTLSGEQRNAGMSQIVNPILGSFAATRMASKARRTLRPSRGVPIVVANTNPVSCQRLANVLALDGLALRVLLQRAYASRRKRDRARSLRRLHLDAHGFALDLMRQIHPLQNMGDVNLSAIQVQVSPE
jgi:hypothetical protein